MRLFLSCVGVLLAGCGGGETGILVTIRGQSGDAVTKLEIHVARDDGGRWRQDPKNADSPSLTPTLAAGRDLAKDPYRVLIVPGGAPLDETLAVGVVGFRDAALGPGASGGAGNLHFVDGKVVEVDVALARYPGAASAPFATTDGCFCADGLPWMSMANANCEAMVPAGPLQPPPACDGVISPGEARGDRTVPCFVAEGTICHAGTRTCADDARVAFAGGCDTSAGVTDGKTRFCDRYQPAACTDPMTGLLSNVPRHDVAWDPCDPTGAIDANFAALPYGFDVGPATDVVFLDSPSGERAVIAAAPVRLHVDPSHVPAGGVLKIPLLVDDFQTVLSVAATQLAACANPADLSMPPDLSAPDLSMKRDMTAPPLDGGGADAIAIGDGGVSADGPSPTPDLAMPDLQPPPPPFQQRITLALPSQVAAIAAGDLNGDKTDDVAVVTAQAIYPLEGIPGGKPFVGPQIAQLTGGISVAVGELTGDKLPDIVVGLSGAPKVQVFPNLGNYAFNGPMGFATTASNPVAVAVADVNRDLFNDILTANSQNLNGIGGGSILYGQGNFNFKTTSLDGTFQPQTITAGDYNGDGNVDVVLAGGMPNVYYYANLGNGGFAQAVVTPTGAEPRLSATADFNEDKLADVVVPTHVAPSLAHVLAGSGNGPATVSKNAVATGAISVAVADYDRDGHLDVAVLSDGSLNNVASTVQLLLGHGDGTFAPMNAALPAGPTGAKAVVTGDFNGDGKADLVVANPSNGLTVYLAQ